MKYLFLMFQVTVDTNVTVWARKEEKGASWQQKVRFAPQIFSFHLCQHDKYRLHPHRNKSWTKQSSFPNTSFHISSIFMTGQSSFRCKWTFLGLHSFRYIFCLSGDSQSLRCLCIWYLVGTVKGMSTSCNGRAGTAFTFILCQLWSHIVIWTIKAI